MEIKDKIKEVRKSKGISTYKLAEIMTNNGFKIAQSGISKIENGNKKIDFDTLNAICRALDVSISFFSPDNSEDLNFVLDNIKEYELYSLCEDIRKIEDVEAKDLALCILGTFENTLQNAIYENNIEYLKILFDAYNNIDNSIRLIKKIGENGYMKGYKEGIKEV